MNDGVQERYLSYYGIKRAIKDGATLEVHYIRDKVPFAVDEKTLNIGYRADVRGDGAGGRGSQGLHPTPAIAMEGIGPAPGARGNRGRARCWSTSSRTLTQMASRRSWWPWIARACARFKDALDTKLKAQGPAAGMVGRHHLRRAERRAGFGAIPLRQAEAGRTDRLFQADAEAMGETGTAKRFGDDRSKWRPPLKILIVCDRLLTGFDAPIEQVMYLDKPLRDHNLLQAIARTNRPLPDDGEAHRRRGGLLRRVQQSDEGAELRREHPRGSADRLGCAQSYGARRGCALHGAVSRASRSRTHASACWRHCERLDDPEAAKNFEHNFKSLERLWEAVSPDPCLYEHRYIYNWLCGIYIAHRRRQQGAGKKDTYGELSAKTRELIEENTTFMDLAEALPVFKIDKDYVTQAGRTAQRQPIKRRRWRRF